MVSQSKKFIDLDLQKIPKAKSLVDFNANFFAQGNLVSNSHSKQHITDSNVSLQSQAEVVENRISIDNTETLVVSANYYRQKYLNLLHYQLTILKNLEVSTRPQTIQFTASTPFLPVNIESKTKLDKNQLKSRKNTFIQIISFWIIALLLPPLTFWGLLDASAVYDQNNALNVGQVAGIHEERVSFGVYDREAYNLWITDKVGLLVPAETDLDNDGLTNLEEFWLNTDPTHKNSCNENTDLDNLLQLIHPATCQPLDLQNLESDSSLIQIFHFPTLAQKLFLSQIDESLESKSSKESLYDIFQVQDLSQIDLSDRTALEREISLNNKKNEYLFILQKTNDYIIKYRSYEEYDRNYPVPVSPAIFLETSLKYRVPLKYVLAIARLESRFGTDRYTKTGQLTRPGAHKNIFCIGLDDSGNSLTFNSWEEGVYAFGRWYRYFDDKGVSDCQKWRIYNPNGDYCAKVEKLAAEIEQFLFSR